MTLKARTLEEMRFVASLRGCPYCGFRELGALELAGGGSYWSYCSICPGCGRERRFDFVTAGDPAFVRAARFELGPGGSQLIAPIQFLQVFDEASAKIPDDLQALAPRERQDASWQIERALTCITELLKVVPFREGPPPAGTDARLDRPWLEREYIRLKNLINAARPRSTVSRAALDAHLAWLHRGGQGDGYLELTGESLADQWYAGEDFTFASFSEVDFTNADLGRACFDEVSLDRCVLRHAVVDEVSLTNARIAGGDWSNVRLWSARLNAAEIEGVDFSKSDADRSFWIETRARDVNFDGARFNNSVFDGAHFERCKFRRAGFRRYMPNPEPTSRGAHFIECDFTGADLSERDLTDTTFVRCRLAGAVLPAVRAPGLVLQDCDVDETAFRE